jgi:AbrB family looped-hinge helix DNA binding protein
LKNVRYQERSMGKWTARARIQPRHQVTVPKEVRCDLGVEPGDDLMWVKSADGGWHVSRLPKSFEELMAEIGPKMAGIVTLDDVFRWRRESDDPD